MPISRPPFLFALALVVAQIGCVVSGGQHSQADAQCVRVDLATTDVPEGDSASLQLAESPFYGSAVAVRSEGTVRGFIGFSTPRPSRATHQKIRRQSRSADLHVRSRPRAILHRPVLHQPRRVPRPHRPRATNRRL